jgi:putative flippase GtrA
MRLSLLLAKYLTAGVINTLIGYAVIFGCMANGIDPKVSNVSGYGEGFVASFLQSRYWVFRSRGNVVGDGLRFIPAFLVAFGVNFLVLHGMLEIGVNPYLAQLVAGSAYVGVGFSLNYVFVFRK